MKTAFEIAMAKDTGYDPNAPSPSSNLTREQLIQCIIGGDDSADDITRSNGIDHGDDDEEGDDE